MKLSEEQALYRAASQCSTSERCRHDISQLLLRWGLEKESGERILKRLVDEKYIDEERYSRAFVNDKSRYEKWGRQKIQQALIAKHIPEEAYQSALDALDAEEYATRLHDILKAKAPTVKASSDYERNGKLIRFALGRGYELDLIMKALEKL
jgi:regulatory protein